MERKVPFVVNNLYHLYSRGVEKRTIFQTDEDRERFLILLLLCNRKASVHMREVLRAYRGEPSVSVFQNTADEPLVDILAYALMPNHFHLVAKERSEGGISRFMLKLMTAYSMFFNTKYERSGPLFTRPFRSKHVDSDAYLRWVFAYVSLNPLDLIAPDWGERGVSDIPAAHEFMQQYRFSSFPDYINERPETRILAKNELPLDIPHQVDELLEEFAKGREFSLSTSA